MIFVALNAIFAWIFFMYARAAIPRGLQFLRVGWLALQVYAPRTSDHRNVVVRYAVSEGGQFFLGGLFSLGTGIVSAALAIVFGLNAITMALPQ